MEQDFPSQKLRALPVQLIETGDGVILKRGRIEIQIGGDRAAEIVSLVLAATAEDRATPEEIAKAFAAPDRPAVIYLVEQLAARRILVPADIPPPPGEAWESNLEVFYWHFGASAEQVTERLNAQRLVILGVNGISRQLAASLLASGVKAVEVVDYPLLRNLRFFSAGGELQADQWPALLPQPRAYGEWANGPGPEALDCLIATSDFGGLERMREWNEFCVARRRPFLPVVLQDLIGYVGPLVVPGETACFECLRARQNAHLDDPVAQRASEQVAFEGQAGAGFHPAMASVLGDIAAIELTKFYGGGLPLWRVGTLIEVNLLAPRLDARKVLKVPRCPVCSTLNRRASTAATTNFFNPDSGAGA